MCGSQLCSGPSLLPFSSPACKTFQATAEKYLMLSLFASFLQPGARSEVTLTYPGLTVCSIPMGWLNKTSWSKRLTLLSLA